MSGAGDFAVGDGFLDINIGEHCAFGFEVAEHSEAMGERDLRIARRQDGAVQGMDSFKSCLS